MPTEIKGQTMAQQRFVRRYAPARIARAATDVRLDQPPPAWAQTSSFEYIEHGTSGAPPGARGSGPRRRLSGRIVAAAGALGLVICLLAVGGFAFHQSLGGKLYQNVYVNDQNIGGLTPDGARAALTKTLAPYLNRPVTLTANDKQWTPSLNDLGMAIDLDRTTDEAYRAGRSGGPVGQLWRAFEQQHGAKQYVPLYVRVDDQALNTYLDGLQSQLGTPPHDATVAVQGNQVVVTPGTDGTKLDRDLLRQQLLDSTAHLKATSFALPVTFASPAVTTDAAQQAKVRADALVVAPLALTFNDHTWSLSHDELVSALRFAPNLDVSLDSSAFVPRLNAIAGELKQDPKNAVIGWDSQLVVRQPAKNGQQLNLEASLARIAAWTGDVRTIPLVVDVQKPRITDDVGALGITTRLALGVSNFSGSDAARAHNIAVSAGYLDDTVVAPGEVFSFLDSIGEISTARGYKDGYVILAEQTVPGVGGGVCQVATTMFRAAMYSGLPIEERNPHAYLVGYYTQGGYPVGLDAAVFEPGVDLKFRNETDKYMLIKTSIDSGNLYISIYGPNLGYKVDIGDPVIKNKTAAPDDEYEVDPTLPPGTKKQVEFAKNGEDVAITRTVHGPDGNVVRVATFNTHYQAWPNKFLLSKDVTPPKAVKATTAPNTPVVPTKSPTPPTKPASSPAAAKATLPAKPQPTPAGNPTTVSPTKKP
jgi:vancomycin resistance protein YoaR